MSTVSVEIIGAPRAVGERLFEDLCDTRRASIAVAFAKESALARLDLERWCHPDRELRLVAGTDFALTELDVLRQLGPLPGTTCRVYHSTPGVTFHPKLYLLDKGASWVAYVGSSNFTSGGFFTNVEANVRLEGPADAPEITAAASYFGQLFESEFATPLSSEFEAQYAELQAARREALAGTSPLRAAERLRTSGNLLLAAHRARAAAARWLLVGTPENYAICMRTRTWGHQTEDKIRRYRPGDLFLFHVNGRGVAAMGMFTGPSYWDEAELWQRMPKGSFPWRIRFVTLGELRTGILTRAVLEPLRPAAPKNWFQGYIQASHSVEPTDFEAVRRAFEAAVREESSAA